MHQPAAGLRLSTSTGSAPIEVPRTRGARRRGLLGRTGIEGGLLLERVSSVHTFGMKFAIDVAMLDRSSRVVAIVTLPPRRVTRPRLRVRSVLETDAGSLARWGIKTGDRLDFTYPQPALL